MYRHPTFFVRDWLSSRTPISLISLAKKKKAGFIQTLLYRMHLKESRYGGGRKGKGMEGKGHTKQRQQLNRFLSVEGIGDVIGEIILCSEACGS